MAKTPKPPTMLAVGRRRGFETTLEPEVGSIVGASLTPSLILTSGGGASAENVTGDFVADGLIEITPLSGESFGSASITHLLFDDFRGQNHGSSPSTTAVVGNWNNSAGTVDTSLSVYGNSWRHPGSGILRKTFTASIGFRYSFWLRCATHSDGTVAGGRSKTAWLMDTPSGYLANDDFDLACPTKANSTANAWYSAGNDGTFLTNLGAFMPQNEWVYVRVGYTTNNGYRIVRTGQTFGCQVHSGTANAFDLFPNSTTVSHIDFGSTTDPTYNYGPFQMHMGDGVNASVEIGDASTYSACKALYDCDIVAWSASSILSRVRAPLSLINSGNAHVCITLADRTVLTPRRIS